MKRVVPSPQPPEPSIADAAALGAMIRAARTRTGMTLVDAALTLGVSKQTLTDLETAKASVGVATALRVAKELGVGIFAITPSEREPVRRLIAGLRQGPAGIELEGSADVGLRKGPASSGEPP